MLHHSNSTVDCPSCLLKLEQAHPMLSVYYKLIREKHLDFHLSQTFRDKQAQEDAFKSGLSRKHWPFSKHNVMVNGKPQARAFDFFKQQDGKTLYPYNWVLEIITFCKSHNFNCRYGMDFQDLEDSIHIELMDNII